MPDQVTFKATLEDDVSPNLTKLEKQLKQMGVTPIQIKVILNAVDESTPKIKEAQRQLDKLPKEHKIRLHLDFRSGVDAFMNELKRAKATITKPITMPFKLVDDEGNRLQDSLSKVGLARQQLAYPLAGGAANALGGVVPGGSSLIMGAAAGGGLIGALDGLSQVVEDSVKQNVEYQQAQQKLTIALRDQSGATTELNKVIAANVKSPFTFQQTLQADVLARSYQLPVFKGENKNVPQGYLQVASNMAAAMGTTPDDAMMAVAMARQHMFRRLQLFGIRMTASDFGPSGRFAGMSVDQALEIATKRFSGAMTAQMKTLPGMLSNIKDVVNAQIIRPVGQNLFQAIGSRTGNIEQSLSSPDTQKKIGDAVEKVQHLTVQLLEDLAKVHRYFDIHLKQPLEDVIQAIKAVGQAFGQAFGGASSVVIKTFSEAIMSIASPMASFAKSVPLFGTLLGYMKAMQFAGLGGMVKPLQTITNAFNPRSSQGMISGIFKAIGQVPGMVLKTAGFLITKDLLDAHKASTDLNNQFKGMGVNMVEVNKQVADMAVNLGQSETHMKNLVAAAAQGIPTGRMGHAARANLALQIGRGSQQLSDITGWDPNQIIATIESAMKDAGTYTKEAFHTFGNQILTAAAVAKQFGDSMSTAMQVMQTFSASANPIGLGGLQGLPSLLALSSSINSVGVTPSQMSHGIYTPDAVMQQMLQQYGQPTIQGLDKIPKGQLGQYWNFKSSPQLFNRYGANEQIYEQQAAAGQQLQSSSRTKIGQIAPTALTGTQGVKGIPQIPVLWNSAGLSTNFNQLQKGSPEQQAENVKKAWSDTVANWNKAVQKIASYQAKIDQTQNSLDQFNQAQAAVNLQLQAFQHQVTLQQRVVEDASLKLQQYTFDNLRPLERELTRVQNSMDIMNHTMTDAQYNMTKFADGLLMGEQAALNQLHALSLYNEQLNYLKMQYTQIGAQLGTQVYTRGYSARVAPLMGLSLEMQMQQLQRRQELAQAKYDITYGEGHYQMQQAQRSIFQRTEMPLDKRLHGIKQSQALIDGATIQQKKLGDVQFKLQEKMFRVNEVIANQQDHLTKLQNSLTSLQQSHAMRQLEDEQYNLGQVIGQTNIHLTHQNQILNQWQNTIDDLNQKKQDLQHLFDAMLVFNGSGSAQFDEARKMIREAAQTGTLTGGHWKNIGGGQAGGAGHMRGQGGQREWIPGQQESQLLSSIDQAQKTYQTAQKANVKWYDNKADFFSKWTEVLKGIFTGDTWRKIADRFAGTPVIGSVANTAFNAVGMLAPVITGVASVLLMGGTAAYLLRRVASRFIPDAVKELSIPQIGSSVLSKVGMDNTAAKLAAMESQTIGKKLNMSFLESMAAKFEPYRHPIRFWQRSLGRGIGAGLGLAVSHGDPMVGMLGGYFGGVIADRHQSKTRDAWEVLTSTTKDNVDAAKEQKVAADKHSRVIALAQKVEDKARETAHKVSTAASVLEEDVGMKKGFGKFVGLFSSHIGRFGGFIGKFAGFVGAVDIFKASIDHFTGLLPGLKNLLTELAGKLGIHIGGASAASTVTRGAGSAGEDAKAAISSLQKAIKNNPQLEKTLEALKKGGATAFKWGGRLLRFGGAAAGALSFVPAAKDLIKGNIPGAVGQGANALSYFAPGIGQYRALTSILQGLGIEPKNWSAPSLSNPLSPAANLINKFLGGGGSSNPNVANQEHILGLPNLQSATFFNTPGNQQIALIDKGNKEEIQLRVKNKQQALALAKQFDKLTIAEYDQFWQLSGQKQRSAQQAALTGPNGLRDWLENNKQVLTGFWSARVHHAAGALSAENKTYATGYTNILKTTSNYLSSMGRQMDNWEKNMGLSLTKGEKLGARSAKVASQGITAASQTAASVVPQFGFEHGGMVTMDHHKDKLGHGRVVRMAEEGHAEMVIPLAPHRRSRAKMLLHQTAGYLNGYLSGGIVDANKLLCKLPPAIRAREKSNPTDILPGFAAGGTVDGIQGVSPNSRLSALVNSANSISSKHFPYLWGGGHSSSTFGGPYDCSGAVSALLRSTGYFGKGQSEVSGWFDNQFLAGPGAASIYSNPTHVYMVIGGRGWGTSGANPGGGAGWFSGGARPGFAAHHLPGLDKAVTQAQLTSWENAGGTGAGTAVAPIKLMKVPEKLRGMGLMGAMQYHILQNLRNKVQRHANAQAASGGSTDFTGRTLGNPNAVSGRFSENQKAFASTLASLAGLSPRVVGAWMAAEEPVGLSVNPASGNQNWLNIAQFDSGAGALAFSNVFSSAASGARATNAFLRGTWGGASSGIQNILRTAGSSPAAQMRAIASSGWASSGYNGGSTLFNLFNQGYLGGLPRVPHDNFMARLHKDEMVIPAAMAQAARSRAGGGMMGTLEPPRGVREQRRLKDDTGWIEFYDKFKKIHDNISLLQYDIHKVRKELENANNKKDKTRDTDLLAALNSQLRARNAQLNATTGRFNKAVARAISSTGDTSGGENTLAGVQKEKAIRRNIIYNLEIHSPKLHRAEEKLHTDLSKYHKDLSKYLKDLSKYHELMRKGRHHKLSSREEAELKKIRRIIEHDRHRVHRDKREVRIDRRDVDRILSGLKKEGNIKYLIGAAERGINAGLLKAITGHGLTKKQDEAYKKLEQATRVGSHATQAQVHRLENALKRSLEVGQKKEDTNHKKTHEHVKHVKKAIDDSSTKQVREHKKTHEHVKHVKKAIDDSSTKQIREHLKSHKYLNDIRDAAKHHYGKTEDSFKKGFTHYHKHEQHMEKTEKHQKKLEEKMEALVRKDYVINITNVAQGATITSTRKGTGRRSR